MKFFEAIFFKEYKSFVRYFDSDLKKSKITENLFNSVSFVPDENGMFRTIDGIRCAPIEGKKVDNCLCYHNKNQVFLYNSKINLNKNPRIWFLDIETTAHSTVDAKRANERIVSIQLLDNYENINYIISNEPFKPQQTNPYKYDDKEYDFRLVYFKVDNESQILQKLFDLIEEKMPLIITAYNGDRFDFPYLYKRSQRCGLKLGFSPFGESQLVEAEGNTYIAQIEAPGVYYIDYLDLYKKFTWGSQPSYALDYIAQIEIGERKVSHSCFRTFDGFRTGEGYVRPQIEPKVEDRVEYILYHTPDAEIISKSREIFTHYSVIDTYILRNLENKKKFFGLLIELGEFFGCNLNLVLKTTTPWKIYLDREFFKNGIVNNQKREYPKEFVIGGYVESPTSNKTDWGFSVDVNSMYPSQIISFNMSPETYIARNELPQDLREEIESLGLENDENEILKLFKENPKILENYQKLLEKYGFCGTINGVVFKQEPGILPKLVKDIFDERKKVKKDYLTKLSFLNEIEKEIKSRKNKN